MRFARPVRVRRSLQATTIALTVLGALLMVAAVGGLRWALARAEARSASAARGRDVIALAHAVARSASLAQTLAGMFLMSGDLDVRSSYERAVDSGRAQLDALAASVGDDAEGTARVAELRERFERWVQDSTAFVDVEPPRRGVWPGGAVFAPERLSEERGRHIASLLERMESVQRAVDALIGTEASAVTEGDRAVVSLGRAIDRGAVAATIGMLVAAAAALVIFLRRVGRPLVELTASALAIARGDLRRRVALSGEDEIGSLAASFNVMAEQLDRQVRQDEALRHARELMHAAQDAGELERVVALLAPECVPGTSGRLYLLDGAGERLVPRGGWAVAGPGEPFPAPACWAFRLGRVHEVSGGKPNVRCAHTSAEARDVVCIPLGARGAILGVLEVAFAGATPRGITELGDTIALTLANLRVHEQMREEAQRDGLTGCFNRRHFERALERELARALEQERPLSVVLVDIDHFKRFNDSHGHAAGDAVLRQVAVALAERCRGSDVICRFGGEEFVVLLPECGIEDAIGKAEAFRTAVRGMKVQCDGRLLEQVTVSIGVAAFPADGASRDTVVGAADEALYRSKEGGRDRVTCAVRSSSAASAA
jgi:diguanylate cyclase (GGDEF)-like protein